MKALKPLFWGLTLLIPCCIYFLAPTGINPKLPLYFTLTSMAVMAWMFNIFPAIGVAALLTFAYMLGGVASPDVVFKPWTTVLPWLSFAAIIIGLAMEKTGLAKRVALWCIRLSGGSFNGLALGFILGGIILATFLSSILARMVILCTIAVGIIDALKIDSKSRLSSAIIFMAFIAGSGPQFLLLHSSESNIWAFDVLFKGTDVHVDFWTYALQSTPFSICYTFISMLLIYMVKGKENFSGENLKKFLIESYQELGPMKVSEKKLAVMCILLISAFVFQPWTHVNPVYFLCCLAVFCYMPFINILDPKEISNLGIMFLVFVTGCMSIGFVGGAVGANGWIISKLVPLLSGWSENISILMSYIVGVIINFALTPLAALGAVTPSIGELGKAMQVNPLPIFYAFNYGIDQYLFPYETVYFLYIFVTERITLRHIVPALILRIILCGLLLAFFAIPWWKFVGIL